MGLLANSNAIESGGYPIQRSLRFRSSASAYLSKTWGANGNRQKWTWSGWVKRGQLGATKTLFGATNTTSDAHLLQFTSSDTLQFMLLVGGSYSMNLITTQVFRDPSAFYHIVAIYDSAQATASNRASIYVNGSQVTSFGTSTYSAQNTNGYISGTTYTNYIGYDSYFDGYLAEVNFIDGQALTPSSFGYTEPLTGVWQPLKYMGTYGTNGFYLPFSDNTSATTLAYDKSGNGNNWTPNNISTTAGETYDSMTDVPTLTSATAANYCVLNPIRSQFGSVANPTLSEGNLKASVANSVGTSASFGTMALGSAKYYWEVTITQAGPAVGHATGEWGTSINGTTAAYINDGYYRKLDASYITFGASFTTNDVIGVAFDGTNGKLYFSKNGTWQNSGDPVAGTGYAETGLAADTYFPSVMQNTSSGATAIFAANFGQRPFSYTPPTGFVALNTYNLPDPTIKKPNQYMDATTYTGTGSALSVTNAAGFQPDFVWVKGRSGATDHALYDAVRGVQKQLESNTTTAETTETTGLTAFNSNGFSVGALAQMNTNTATYVGWQWKESATAGFDIVTYTGDGTQPRQISHSLGVAPKFIITHSRSVGGYDWNCWFTGFADNENIILNKTDAKGTASNTFPSAAGMTSTYFTIGSGAWINGNGTTYVAYLFAEIAGFSKFGSYTGNGSTDGPFNYLGFQPKFVMIKQTNTTRDWYILDGARDPYNAEFRLLMPNTSGAEDTGITGGQAIDAVSNGFKLRTIDAAINQSGGSYIYACFASNPFKTSLAR